MATAALTALLREARARPLFAHLAGSNGGSLRVFERCGLALGGEDRAPAATGGEAVGELILRLG